MGVEFRSILTIELRNKIRIPDLGIANTRTVDNLLRVTQILISKIQKYLISRVVLT
jgi:hypothetical protein